MRFRILVALSIVLACIGLYPRTHLHADEEEETLCEQSIARTVTAFGMPSAVGPNGTIDTGTSSVRRAPLFGDSTTVHT